MFARRRRRGGSRRWLAALVLLLVFGVVGVSVYVGWSLSHAEPKPVDRTPAELGLTYDTVEFPATDGVVVRGWFLPGAVPEAAGEGLDNEPAAETPAAADTRRAAWRPEPVRSFSPTVSAATGWSPGCRRWSWHTPWSAKGSTC